MDLEKPYKMKSIMELYPESNVEVRVYVIQAFQVLFLQNINLSTYTHAYLDMHIQASLRLS